MSGYQNEAAEAMCSALYQMPFSEFLGEKDLPDGDNDTARVAWFHLGEHPKDLRVAVIKPIKKDEVRVLTEWRNYYSDGRAPLKGNHTATISCYAASQNELMEATSAAVLRVLEIYKDVLAEEGVAGPIDKLAPEPTERADEE